MINATLIDFEDSFTFNVVQELSSVGFNVTVINWKDYDKNPVDGLLVLGPGPGHPEEYEKIFYNVNEWLVDQRPFFGVCLGHQIFWHLKNEQIVRSQFPLHGQKIKLNLSDDWRKWFEFQGDVFVQRYNSLAVLEESASRDGSLKNFIQDGEILISKGKRLLTYQFHPESIGTSFRHKFMRQVKYILDE